MDFQQKWMDAAQTRLSFILDGKLVFGKFEELQSLVFELKKTPPKHITFDLTNVDMIDSSGLGLLIIANELTGEQHNVTLINPNPQVRHLFDICEIDKLMVIEG
ncbi:MAG: STAS domain-containing protein [Terasakiella sp.]|uniref:STAS domain-containing protein n=1 Tax=unclassified Terasakiella TaxID=2614952 RepID=UPI003B000F04